MADVPPSELRIGDTERENALTALGEHMSAGRLDIDEYGDRTAKVAAARTRGELLALFTDLPEPHPRFGQAPSAAAVPRAATDASPVPVVNGMPLAQRMMAAAMPLASIVAVVLFFALGHAWEFFLIPAGVAILGGAIFGDDWKHNKAMIRERQRQERREFRRRTRGW
ncbi:MAG TPA: DUF1707 domain-containing protein [Pseudonocardiaceae bacterium]